MAILAQLGKISSRAIAKPTIRHLATGDELVAPDTEPATGQIRDTNSSLLQGLIANFGIELDSQRVPDHPASIRSMADEKPFNLLLLSGGASVGDHDHGAAVLQEMGFQIHFDKVNLRPGKPLTFATRGDQIAFVIPGNPVSHFVCFHVAIRLAIEILCGIRPAWSFLDLEISGSELLKTNPRETFWPAAVHADNGRLVVSPKNWSTSGDTFSLTGTNALIRIGEGARQTLLLDLPHSGQ
jgi:molybdopterin molybdotransferase